MVNDPRDATGTTGITEGPVGGAAEPVDLAMPLDLTAFSGSRDPLFSAWLGEQVVNCQYLPAALGRAEQERRAAGVLAQVAEIGPRNGLEGLLAGQMVAMHGAGCELLRRGIQAEAAPQLAELLMRTSTRMLTLFARQTELLLRLRGRERQTLRIEHVRKVEDGRVSVTAETERAGAA